MAEAGMNATGHTAFNPWSHAADRFYNPGPFRGDRSLRERQYQVQSDGAMAQLIAEANAGDAAAQLALRRIGADKVQPPLNK